MSTIRRIGSTRFFFYSNGGAEPRPIHVEQAGAVAKFWLEPVSLASSSRFPGHELRRLERLVTEHRGEFLEGLTSSSPSVDPRAIDVASDDNNFTVRLADGGRVTAPLAWFARLLHAAPDQGRNWRLIGGGQGIHWPDVDEDISVSGLRRGAAAPEASKRAV